MDAKQIRQRLKTDRVLMLTYEREGPSYSLDNGVGVSKRLAAELTGQRPGVQGDLFLQPSEDGLFPGFTQTWRAP